MKFAIKHEIKGRMRIHVAQYRMSCAQADTLLYFLQNDIQVSSAKAVSYTHLDVYKRQHIRCEG